MTLKVTQSHQNCYYLIGHKSLPISGLYSNNIAILYRFRDTCISTVTVYVTAYNIEKFFSLDKTVKITSHVLFLIHSCALVVILRPGTLNLT